MRWLERRKWISVDKLSRRLREQARNHYRRYCCKSLFRVTHEFPRTADAFPIWRCEGAHCFVRKRSRSFASALQSVPAAEVFKAIFAIFLVPFDFHLGISANSPTTGFLATPFSAPCLTLASLGKMLPENAIAKTKGQTPKRKIRY
jgi:hypothetical protein